MSEKQIGKIRSVRLGSGGYQDAMFGLTFDLGGESWGCGDFWGTWRDGPSKNADWTKETQVKSQGAMIERLKTVMLDAKVSDFTKLAGVPVEVSFENMRLTSWRVLKEVL